MFFSIKKKYKYYINLNVQRKISQHEIHREDCRYVPKNGALIGEFEKCQDAVMTAKKAYSRWIDDGCYFCCRECNTG